MSQEVEKLKGTDFEEELLDSKELYKKEIE